MTKRMRQVMGWALCAALVGPAALALDKNATLYVRSRNTRLVDKPNGKVVAVLQPGEQVKWQGVVEGSPGWHQVITSKGKKGALLTANLSTKPPSTEIVATEGARAMDTSTFLTSGAATKALAPAAMTYGEQKNMAEAAKEVRAMEALSKSVELDDVAKHAEQAGLPQAVGPRASR